MKCTALLVAEHKIILRVLDVLSAMADRATNTGEMDREDVRSILQILRRFGDELHQGKEESALFPVFTAACERFEIDSVRHMLFEHDQDRSLVEGMQDALQRSNAADFAHHARRLTGILRTHIRKEDQILFELIDRTLTQEQDEKVVAGFAAFDKDFKDHGFDNLLHTLRTLEWKYLSRAA